ncbi:MAG: methionine biosynthesis protein MetW [Endomicrobia bacterium]|nr:methionine biosynthesis protein MetW [Endomicrobiia bacterium]MCL2506124.1 methionine biosynthesis protein MetW [Endomicrobiia bacterium]
MGEVISNTPLEYRKIAANIEKNSKVLDLGCGDGDLMHYLMQTKNVNAQGIEISEDAIYSCVEKGLTVFHSDIEGGMDAYPEKSFDYVIMHNSLQQVQKIDYVIEECFRLGKKVIIGFPNFAYIWARKDLLLGHSPVTKTLPYEWYNTPNLRFLSVKDFEKFCKEKKYKILNKFFFSGGKEIKLFPNLFAQTAVFVISK